MHDEMSLMTLILAMFDALVATIAIFITCELGQRASDAFDEILDEFNKLDWYRFPNGINRMLPLILAVIQKPVVLEVFGRITCCRNVLKTVS